MRLEISELAQPSVKFGPPSLNDTEALAALHVLCWQQAYEEILPAEYLRDLSVAERAENWRTTIADPEVFAMVASVDGVIVGFVSAGPSRKGSVIYADGEIYAIYIHLDHYRKGIGRRFLAEAAKFWLAGNGRSLVVMYLGDNKKAEAFYHSLGGVQVWEGLTVIAGISVADKAQVFNNLAELAA